MRARPSRILTALLGALVLVLATSGSPASAVKVSQHWLVPASATIAIDGHGFGHGTGMSQYGAYGAARQGLRYSQILSFYYPGAAAGTADGAVTVRITADTRGDVLVSYRGGLVVSERATGRRLALPAGLSGTWRLSAGGADTTIISYASGGVWRYWNRVQGEGEFYASGGVMTLLLNGGRSSAQYRGTLRAAIPAPGVMRRETVNAVTMEHYLRGVVPLEMPSSWSPAAVQAQSVAARTYAAHQRSEPKASHYQICDTTTCQVYGGYSAETAASNAAIDATRGVILTHQGRPAFTQFSSSNGGWTNAGSAPYLTARQDPYDGWSGNANHTWLVRITDVTIERAWPELGNLTGISVTDRTGNGDWSGRANTVIFTGSAGRVTVTGAQVRTKLGLKSTWFTFRVAPRG